MKMLNREEKETTRRGPSTKSQYLRKHFTEPVATAVPMMNMQTTLYTKVARSIYPKRLKIILMVSLPLNGRRVAITMPLSWIGYQAGHGRHPKKAVLEYNTLDSTTPHFHGHVIFSSDLHVEG